MLQRRRGNLRLPLLPRHYIVSAMEMKERAAGRDYYITQSKTGGGARSVVGRGERDHGEWFLWF